MAVFSSGEVEFRAALDKGPQWERKTPVPPVPWVRNGTFSKAAGSQFQCAPVRFAKNRQKI
jgi:hypothetical protein